MTRNAALVAIALSSAACSLALGIDKNDYTRGNAVTQSDATAPRSDGGGDGDGGDANSSVDGDAGTKNEGGTVPTSPCAVQHLFCDDFDGPGTLPQHGWDPPFTENGSTVTIDMGDAVSPPNALKVVGNPNSSAAIDHPPLVTASGTKDYTLAYDLRAIDSGPGVAMTDLAVGTYRTRIILLANGTITVDEWDDNLNRVSSQRASATNVLGKWVHVELTLHFVPKGQSGARVVLRVDGSTVVDDTAAPTVSGGPVGFSVGDIDHPNGGVQFRFDNVTFDTN